LVGLYWWQIRCHQSLASIGNVVVGLGTLGVFGVVMALSRLSLSSMLVRSLFCVDASLRSTATLFAVAGGLYVILRHRSNIQRLLAGTEPTRAKTTART